MRSRGRKGMQPYFLKGVLACLLILLAGCQVPWNKGELNHAGLLLEDTKNDQGWGTKGYKGLLAVQEQFGNKVYYKESIKTEQDVIESINDFKDKKVNLVFGHGKIYADIFSKIAPNYPEMHFVSFNGEVTGKNVTSFHLNSYAMGFFAGMLASEMSKNEQIGIIAAKEWQPEIEGYADGAAYQNKNVVIHQVVIDSWSDTDKALHALETMTAAGADVFYPIGDSFTIPVIQEVKKKGHYAIGYVSDHSDLGQATILTSTVQNVDNLYKLAAERMEQGTLEAGNLTFDFKDGALSFGKFSPEVPDSIQQKIKKDIENYIQTGVLPNGEAAPLTQ
jgi:transcriptional activator of comK gene